LLSSDSELIAMTSDNIVGGRDLLNDFDLDAPDFAENYEEALATMVSKCPVAHSNVAGGYWVISRYADVRETAQNWESFSSEGGFEPGRGGEGGAKLYPVELDPPYQTRWRNALAPYFAPRAIREREDSIREQVNAILDTFIESGKVDWVDGFAAHLPGRVFFATFLDVPLSELPFVNATMDAAMRGPMEGRGEAWGKIAGFLDAYMKERQAQPPRGDFIDAILAGVDDKTGQPCPWEHKLFTIIDLLAGGIGTTTYMLSGMVHHLATHPEDYARLEADESLWDGAIEEFIRYYASIVALGRAVTQDSEIAGQKFVKGDFLMLSFAAACRDPELFENPHEVDITRQIPVNPAFSFGPHRCIGSHIARLEARVTLGEIFRRVRNIRIAEGGEPVYSNSSITRNMDRLVIEFTPGPREN
jgi:cytochrome P450